MKNYEKNQIATTEEEEEEGNIKRHKSESEKSSVKSLKSSG